MRAFTISLVAVIMAATAPTIMGAAVLTKEVFNKGGDDLHLSAPGIENPGKELNARSDPVPIPGAAIPHQFRLLDGEHGPTVFPENYDSEDYNDGYDSGYDKGWADSQNGPGVNEYDDGFKDGYKDGTNVDKVYIEWAEYDKKEDAT